MKKRILDICRKVNMVGGILFCLSATYFIYCSFNAPFDEVIAPSAETKYQMMVPASLRDNKYAAANLQRCYELEDSIICIKFYGEDYRHKAYFTKAMKKCKDRPTIGPGLTSIDGNPVRLGDTTTVEQSISDVKNFLRKNVYPATCFVKKKMSDQEIMTTCDFVYNLGAEQFCHHHPDGTFAAKAGKDGKKPGYSQFYQGLNRGDSPEELARYLTGYRNAGGSFSKGLIKRRWFQGAILTKSIWIREIGEMRIASFYNEKNWKCFYANGAKADKDGYYTPDFSEEKVRRFVEEHTNKGLTVNKLFAKSK